VGRVWLVMRESCPTWQYLSRAHHAPRRRFDERSRRPFTQHDGANWTRSAPTPRATYSRSSVRV